MDTKYTAPQTLLEMINLYSDPKVCHDAMVSFRWPNGVACPHCGSVAVWFTEKRLRWQCKDCKKQFSVKVGTIFEDSPLSLCKWLPAIWLIVNAKNGISSCELARSVGVTQKTAWFMLHRIREVLEQGTMEKLSGFVEADETYIGGKAINKHASKKPTKTRGMAGKTAVLGMLERGGKAKAKVIPETSHKALHPNVRKSVKSGSVLITDAHGGYKGLENEYLHAVVDHAQQYVKDHVIHTNGMENFWSLLKRAIKGTYVAIEPAHLDAYLDEQCFRFNERHLSDGGRFEKAVGAVNGKRLTYDELTSSFISCHFFVG